MKTKDVQQMITATQVARIWNERAAAEGKEAHYTRWSVYGQRHKLAGIDTELGRLFSREQAMTMPLPRYNPRPDTTKRNKELKGKKRDTDTWRFLEQPENEPAPAQK
jgi:hypothetical protein